MQEYTARSGSNSSQGFIKHLATMIHDEPIIHMGIRTLQAHCLESGIQLRYGTTNAPPTPNFQKHIDKYYMPFCRDAILSFLAVGFVPYRIRRTERGAKIPEVLPLGTFSWHVARGSQMSLATPWESIGKNRVEHDAIKRRVEGEEDNQPLLKYIVSSVYCQEPVHCYAYLSPQITFSCTSPLASLVQPYLTLCMKRDCTLRADAFNSQPSIVFEQQDKSKLNDITETGASLTEKGIEGDMDVQFKTMGGRQDVIYDMLDRSKVRSNIPDEAIALVAPKNHSIHSLEKSLTPKEMLKEELAFARIVSLALGLPSAMLLQGGGVVGGSSGFGSAKDSWAENTEASNRLLLDTCKDINWHLEHLLSDIYAKIYKDGGAPGLQPVFKIPLTPTVPFDQLLQSYEARMIDDHNVSKMLQTTWGYPLSKEAERARVEKRKAEFVLPFKDKKDEPGSSK